LHWGSVAGGLTALLLSGYGLLLPLLLLLLLLLWSRLLAAGRTQTIESTMDEMQRQYLIPLQKDAFLCSAKCCDRHKEMQNLQNW